MRLSRPLAGALIAGILVLGLGAKERKLADTWVDPEFEGHRFGKLLVIAITDDQEARRNFENLFVSHLRGKGIEAVTSYSLVEDLGAVEPAQLQEILRLIDERQIDGAISVRAVPLGQLDESAWAAEWKRDVQGNQRLRELIEQTLPVSGKKARRYGVEAAMWDAVGWARVWGCRTDPYTREAMRKGAAEFVQRVMNRLDLEGLIR